MIRKTLTEWLSAVYQLPVVEDAGQTDVEQAISYDLSYAPIDVRIKSDELIKFEFQVMVNYRCPNGFAGIGFLTTRLSDATNQPKGFNLASTDGAEQVQYETKTEMIISKILSGYIELDYNKARELIKCVKFDDGLPCNETCNI